MQKFLPINKTKKPRPKMVLGQIHYGRGGMKSVRKGSRQIVLLAWPKKKP